MRFVDPDGRDVWKLDEEGNIVKRIEDETRDAFYMVPKDADGDYQRTYTVDADREIYNSISFKYETVRSAIEETVNLDGYRYYTSLLDILQFKLRDYVE